MTTDEPENSREGFSRREFLYRVGVGVPTLSVAVDSAAAAGPGNNLETADATDKFTPLDMSARWSYSAAPDSGTGV